MGVKERRERQKEILRQEILNAARELFAKEGYENVSMRKIAEKIDYSPTTIYLYFEDKSELLRCLCEENFSRLLSRFEALKKECSSPLDCLKKGLHAYIEFGIKHPNHYRVSFMVHPEHPDDPDHYSNDSMGHRTFEVVKSIVEECIKQKIFRDQDTTMISQGLWAAIHGITSLLIVHPDFPWIDRNRLIEHVIETVTNGLKA
ncbi:MAG: TetR/AcrR family transcriptional regulator [Blastocatellia bacterium]|nr:TetR/AcrR family transcriptional regulator [Blastocatellia bacterium]